MPHPEDGSRTRHNSVVRIVREATLADSPGIGKAHAESWRQGYQGLFPSDTLDAAAGRRQEMWTADSFGFKSGTLLVADEAGDISGFVHFDCAGSGKAIGEISGLYVHPAYWGSGTAQALMQDAVGSLADNFTKAILWTHEGAGRARSFYRKSGWSETGELHQETLWDGVPYPAVQYVRALTVLGRGGRTPSPATWTHDST
jgi:GNAT superfamily N-acetyltransferase